MQYTTEKQAQYSLITVQEEKLNANIAPELKSVFVALHSEGVDSVILDLSAVRYTDSSGLSAILIANRLCNEKHGALVLLGVTEHVLKLITISQLEKILNILPTMEEAVDFVMMTALERDLQEGGEEDE
jgi:anti-sigma B factor antagonist